ncbi:MAG TPA: divergent polysaccharide deacetylase family protein [Candidatus Deferrimicrobium sp.]|nr:divergent polysaccharide deacetylase family protein [Candidatus Deferrimicrobium sp.]
MVKKKEKPNKKQNSKQSSKQNSPVFFLIILIAVAVFTVILLEYIDFRKGKKSFIFDQLIPMKAVPNKVDQFNQGLMDILDKNNIECSYHQDDQRMYHFSLEVDAPRFEGLVARIEKIAHRLNGKITLAQVQGMTGKSIALYKVTLDKKVSHWLLITKLKKAAVKPVKPVETKPAETKPVETKPQVEKSGVEVEKIPPRPARRSDQPARLAFIIDDVGAYEIGALDLKKLGIPITAAILPNAPRAREEAEWLQEYGLQMLIHLPMEPQNGDGQTYDQAQTINLHSSDDEIRSLIGKAKKVIPNAIGVNNHQGSLATSNSGLMTRTLNIIKEEGLFFVDSRTIGNTVAYDVAKTLGMKATYKDAFLDHVKSYAHSIEQVHRLVEIALQKGEAIGIGHPNESTLKAIRDSLPYIRSHGVTIVFVSELVE